MRDLLAANDLGDGDAEFAVVANFKSVSGENGDGEREVGDGDICCFSVGLGVCKNLGVLAPDSAENDNDSDASRVGERFFKLALIEDTPDGDTAVSSLPIGSPTKKAGDKIVLAADLGGGAGVEVDVGVGVVMSSVSLICVGELFDSLAIFIENSLGVGVGVAVGVGVGVAGLATVATICCCEGCGEGAIDTILLVGVGVLGVGVGVRVSA